MAKVHSFVKAKENPVEQTQSAPRGQPVHQDSGQKPDQRAVPVIAQIQARDQTGKEGPTFASRQGQGRTEGVKKNYQAHQH
jgi:hypothetical protein